MNKVKAWKCLLLLMVYLMQTNVMQVRAEDVWPTGPAIDGPSAIVMEASTGTVLYEKNAHEELYPASITKIMTALLAIENCDMDEEVVFSANAVYGVDGAHIARDLDEVMTMEQCLYALMLVSANECAYAIAEHVGGDYDTFIQMMNDRAKELGCENTHFTNPHGLPDENHYTSAYDMALISREALKYDTFRTIIGTQKYTIPPTNKHEEETFLRNHHQMFSSYKGTEYLYEGCIGGKTGYTDVAKNTLVTYASRNGMDLICVVLNEKTTMQYKDTTVLFDAAFENFQLWNVSENEAYYTEQKLQELYASGTEDTVLLDQTGCIVLPKTASFADATAALKEQSGENDEIAFLRYTYASHEIGGADVTIVRAEESSEVMEEVESPKQSGKKTGVFVRIMGIILLALVVVSGAAYGGWRFLQWYRANQRKHISHSEMRKRKYHRIQTQKKKRRKRRK